MTTLIAVSQEYWVGSEATIPFTVVPTATPNTPADPGTLTVTAKPVGAAAIVYTWTEADGSSNSDLVRVSAGTFTVKYHTGDLYSGSGRLETVPVDIVTTGANEGATPVLLILRPLP